MRANGCIAVRSIRREYLTGKGRQRGSSKNKDTETGGIVAEREECVSAAARAEQGKTMKRIGTEKESGERNHNTMILQR